MSLTVYSLLEETTASCQESFKTATREERRQLIADIWKTIRNKGLYGGQPRSTNSDTGVTLARLALSMAKNSTDQESMLEASCMMAYTLNANEQYAESIEYYWLAIERLEEIDDYARAARNRLGLLVALSMLGRHEEAIQVGLMAQSSFLKCGDQEGYARLCVNLGTVYQRVDRHAQGLEYHEKAMAYFRKTGNEEALARIYVNIGNTLGWLDRFEEADQFYALSEQSGSRLELTDLLVQARYNRAYLYFLRGRSMQAVEQFQKVREWFNQQGSFRHAALCDLDETEIYLQLNLPNDAARMARSAIEAFQRLDMRYERAKATGFLGIALTQNRQFGDALQIFSSSESLFEQENNRHWVALVKLYRAEVLYAVGRLWEARSLATSAYDNFTETKVTSKRIFSAILLGRIALELNQAAKASNYARDILDWTVQSANPLLLFPAYAFCACVAERSGHLDEAGKFFRLAAGEIENRPARLLHDELRIEFFPGKRAVYEALVRLALSKETDKIDVVSAFRWCQRAKSTVMFELASHHMSSMRSHGGEGLLSRIGRIRDELNSSYLRLQSEKPNLPALSNVSSIEIKENELLHSLRELSEVDPAYSSLHTLPAVSVEGLQAELGVDATLIEFFINGNEVIAFVVSHDRLEVFRQLSTLARVNYLETELQAHFLKVRATHEHGHNETTASLSFANSILGELHQQLFEPLQNTIRTRNLIIVPHGPMRSIPFAALYDGENYLIDRFDITQYPSASAVSSISKRDPIAGGRPLIAAAGSSGEDEEFRALRRLAADADWCTGAAFTRDWARNNALRSEFVHISTDLEFRQDNPLFSSIRCAESWMTALDLYSLSWATNLITLSGNMHSAHPFAAVDGLGAIVEGLLYAGARSVLTNLWQVDSKTAAEFMEVFYGEWQRGATKCEALRRAASRIRETRMNPFFWAPFILIGQR